MTVYDVWHIENTDKETSFVDRIGAVRSQLSRSVLWESALWDAFLLSGMSTSVDRCLYAMDNEEKIMIAGDYDVDGITASALMMRMFRFLGYEDKVHVRLPHRVEDGYGLSKKFIDEAKAADVSLIITVDNGIASYEEVLYAEKNGIQVIITDHHAVPDHVPPAHAVINPHLASSSYPFDDLSGVAVAYLFCSALLQQKGIDSDKREFFLKWHSSYVALGTIADCMPLWHDNRALTHFGVIAFNKSDHAGLFALRSLSQGQNQKYFEAEDIAFQVAPRLNAAGRLGDPHIAYELLVTENQNEAFKKAQRIDEINAERRLMVYKAVKEAEEHMKTDAPLLIAASKEWPQGIVGLIAGRMAEAHQKPCIILSIRDDGVMVASCRSVEGFHMVEAIKTFGDLLLYFGGHAQAAGFSIKNENYALFKEQIVHYTREHLGDTKPEKKLVIDTCIYPHELSLHRLWDIDTFRPFGMQNKPPRFCFPNMKIEENRVIGKEKNHRRFLLTTPDNKKIAGLFWNADKYALDTFKVGSKVDVAGELERNEWNWEKRLQIKMVDIRSASNNV